MASSIFYLNVFCVLFIFYLFTAGALSYSDEHILTYNDGVPDFSSDAHSFILLERTKKEAPPEKKNEAPIADKMKVTKKPTAMDAKPTSNPTDADVKPKAVVNKKESLSTKVVMTTPATDAVHTEETTPVSHEPESTSHATPSSTTEMTPLNTTWLNATAKPVVAKPTVAATEFRNITVQDDEIQANKFLEVDLNDTQLNENLRSHNITTQKVDHHLYYNSSILFDHEVYQKYWVDMDKLKDVKDILSNSHRRAVTVKLNFDFPFYGHVITKIVIATGGFLYTGEYVHSWLSVTQYIAPLMANFHTVSSNYSSIKYVDNGTAFTVQWENVVLQDQPDEGSFTFQCTLFKNGDIVFVYKRISVGIDNLATNHHQIKVGVSDAYIIDRTVFLVRRKTIYEYHRVNIERDEIRNETVIILNALDTCLDMKDCRSCVAGLTNFKCNWCADRCSNGMDRYKQDWFAKGCNNKKRKTVEECLAEEESISKVRSQSFADQSAEEDNNMSVGIAGIMGILFVVCLVLGIGIWLFYAYRNPHTPAGQFLIRYRPSQWSWRRGEARYTAATIHM